MTESPHDRQRFIKVATAQNESEALLIHGLLREAGVPSMLRRAPGSDVPGFLTAGRREVLVAASQTEHARDVLPQAEPGPSDSRTSRAVTASRRFFTKVLVAVAVLAILASCTTELFG